MKYALVTGANRGLGLGFVKELIDTGYFVFMGMRSDANLEYQHENAQPLLLDIENDQSVIEATNVLQSQGIVPDLPNNVYTFAVHPGLVRSDMNLDGNIEPQDSARKILAITKS